MRSTWLGWYSQVSKTVPSSRTPLRAEVEPAHELADDEQVDVPRAGGPEVRVHVELGAEPEHPLFRTHLGCVELGVADGRLEHRVGRTARLECLGGKRVAGRPDRGRSEEVVLEHEVGRELAEHALRDRHDLGADAIAGETGHSLRRHGRQYAK